MSSSTQEFLFGEASQTLVFDCPDGRPSAVVSPSIWWTDNDDTTAPLTATTGSATVETNPSTTIDVASGPSAASGDPRRINVAATTGMAVDRWYRIASTYGHHEDFEVEAIASADYVLSRQPLLNDYEVTTATVKSTRVSIGMLDSFLADLSYLSPVWTPNPRYRVRWEMTVNGATAIYDTYFDVVRYAGQCHVSPLDVAEDFPNWIDWLGPDDRKDQGRGRIRRAYQAVKFDLYGDNKADQAIRNREALDALVRARTVELTLKERVRAGASNLAAALGDATEEYRQRYDQMIRAPVLAMDSSGGGAAVPITPTPLWSR